MDLRRYRDPMRHTPVLALAFTLAFALVVAACGDDTTAGSSAGPASIGVVVVNGSVTVTVDGASSSDHVSVARGTQVHLSVTSDVADEVHLHGYDLMVDVEAGVAGSIDFTANIAGIFEVELESSAFHLIDLEVS
jgi:hypothetical protein